MDKMNIHGAIVFTLKESLEGITKKNIFTRAQFDNL